MHSIHTVLYSTSYGMLVSIERDGRYLKSVYSGPQTPSYRHMHTNIPFYDEHQYIHIYNTCEPSYVYGVRVCALRRTRVNPYSYAYTRIYTKPFFLRLSSANIILYIFLNIHFLMFSLTLAHIFHASCACMCMCVSESKCHGGQLNRTKLKKTHDISFLCSNTSIHSVCWRFDDSLKKNTKKIKVVNICIWLLVERKQRFFCHRLKFENVNKENKGEWTIFNPSRIVFNVQPRPHTSLIRYEYWK